MVATLHAPHTRTQEATVAQIIAVVSLGIFLTLAAFVWNNWGLPMQLGAPAGPRSLAVEDVMQKVDVRSLPKQQIQDLTVVFSEEHDQ
jgi:hypothetical protein